MARWTPDAPGRLRDAAIQLFAERGFESVTAEEIAQRAGLSERTFFRHFPTKEEVLFSEGDMLLAALVDAVRTASEATPRAMLEAVATRLGELFEDDRAAHRRRATVIAGEPALRERELLKHEQWSVAIANAMSERGVPADRAAVVSAAVTGMFRVVYRRWTTDRATTPLAARLLAALDTLTDDLR